MVPNQVRYQLRHIPIGRKGMKKIWHISENPLSLHSLSPRCWFPSEGNKRHQPPAKAKRVSPCDSWPERGVWGLGPSEYGEVGEWLKPPVC